jgi:UDP-3-O-[3-hydroxymyristoyl] glucosamine N-acyltransferase
MDFELSDVFNFLTNKEIVYSVENYNEIPTLYKLSSIKKKISKGLYYLPSDYITEAKDIYDSLIFTDKINNEKDSNIYVIVNNPQEVHYKLASSVIKDVRSGIHPTAIIDKEAVLHPTCYIGPFCIVGNSEIGENVQLLHHITIADNVIIKKNTIIEGNSTIGARGMAWIWDDNGNRIMQPQFGGVIIDEDCLLGTDITIVRGSLNENTIVGKGTIIAHGSKIGHGTIIMEKVHFANNVSIAGNACIESRVFLGSACVISSNVVVSEGCIVGAGAVVNKSFNEKNCTLVGVPAKILKTENFEYKPKGAPKPYKE